MKRRTMGIMACTAAIAMASSGIASAGHSNNNSSSNGDRRDSGSNAQPQSHLRYGCDLDPSSCGHHYGGGGGGDPDVRDHRGGTAAPTTPPKSRVIYSGRDKVIYCATHPRVRGCRPDDNGPQGNNPVVRDHRGEDATQVGCAGGHMGPNGVMVNCQ